MANRNRIKTSPLAALVLVSYLAMLTMNVLANSLPLNGRRTGEVSDSYPNLFTPAGVTFAIWGVIYLLLGVHVLYQLGLFRGSPASIEHTDFLNRIGVLFAISSLANTAWVFAWHYDVIALSAVLIVVMLVCLARIVSIIKRANPVGRQRWLVGVPFSVYFGWLTVATVANITVLLVSWNWDGFGLADSTWAAVMVLIAMAIGTVTMLRNADAAYGLVLIWAFIGILIRQIAPDPGGFDGRYPIIIVAAAVSLTIYLLAEVLILRRRQ